MKSKTGERNVYQQKDGYLVQLGKYKSKYFKKSAPNALEDAIAYRDAVLSGEIVPELKEGTQAKVKADLHIVTKHKAVGVMQQQRRKPKRKSAATLEELGFSWEHDKRTFDLEFRTLEAEERARAAEFQAKEVSEQLMQIKARLFEFERNHKVELSRVEFERFRVMDSVAIIDANYLHRNGSDARIDSGLLRKMLEGMIGSRLETYLFVASLPPESEAKERVERYHSYIGTKAGGGATVIAHELKEVTMTCPHCSARFERRFQWAGDTVIAAEITRWALDKKIPRLILVAGDGDFIYPIRLARNYCKEIVVIGYEGTVSQELQSLANRMIFLDDYVPMLAPVERL